MKFSLLSLVAGNAICNARCPFCISKMTPAVGVSTRKPEVDWRNFHKAALLASRSDTQTVMITGKGEPTIFPDQITDYLEALQKYEFPFIELQTNGILLQQREAQYLPFLERWHDLGLTTISVSVVHYEAEANRKIYLPSASSYIDLPGLINLLHENDYTVRLSVTLCSGYIDSPYNLESMIAFSKDHAVEQLAIRPVTKIHESSDSEVHKWITTHEISVERLHEIGNWVRERGTHLFTYPHGAELFDIHGQNICITNCLTKSIGSSEVRQLIFFPNGTLSFDWEYSGAILLRGALTGREELTQLKRAI